MSAAPVAQLYDKQQLIGKGAYGSVFKAIRKDTGQVVAIKTLDLEADEDDVAIIQREINLLSQLRHSDTANITRYHASYLVGTELWIIMDYCAGGSIRTLMKCGKIEEKFIAVITREVLIAMSYLHKCGILHRDIKAANILLTNEGKVQLCDFGVAGQVTATNHKRNTLVGTPYWMAPEVIMESQYDFKADVWSLGITVYEMATGNPPYADQEAMRAVFLIPRSPPARLEGPFSANMKDFVAQCLNEEVSERPFADELLKAKFIKGFAKLSTSVLRELVVRYEAWIRAGGQRASLAEIVDANTNRESIVATEDDTWDFDFDTMRPSDISNRNELPEEIGSLPNVAQRRARRKATLDGIQLGSHQADHPLMRLFADMNAPEASYNQYPEGSLMPPSQNKASTGLNSASFSLLDAPMSPSIQIPANLDRPYSELNSDDVATLKASEASKLHGMRYANRMNSDAVTSNVQQHQLPRKFSVDQQSYSSNQSYPDSSTPISQERGALSSRLANTPLGEAPLISIPPPGEEMPLATPLLHSIHIPTQLDMDSMAKPSNAAPSTAINTTSTTAPPASITIPTPANMEYLSKQQAQYQYPMSRSQGPYAEPPPPQHSTIPVPPVPSLPVATSTSTGQQMRKSPSSTSLASRDTDDERRVRKQRSGNLAHARKLSKPSISQAKALQVGDSNALLLPPSPSTSKYSVVGLAPALPSPRPSILSNAALSPMPLYQARPHFNGIQSTTGTPIVSTTSSSGGAAAFPFPSAVGPSIHGAQGSGTQSQRNLTSTTGHQTNSPHIQHRRSPSYVLAGPELRVLKMELLETPEQVNAELKVTVESLNKWLEVLETGFSGIVQF